MLMRQNLSVADVCSFCPGSRTCLAPPLPVRLSQAVDQTSGSSPFSPSSGIASQPHRSFSWQLSGTQSPPRPEVRNEHRVHVVVRLAEHTEALYLVEQEPGLRTILLVLIGGILSFTLITSQRFFPDIIMYSQGKALSAKLPTQGTLSHSLQQLTALHMH